MSLIRALLALAVLSQDVHASHRHLHRRHGTGKGVVNLKRAGSSPASSRALSAQRPRFASYLESVEFGAGYAVEIDFGGQRFAVHFDTGSSDLWLPTSNFQCLGPDQSPAPQEECSLGATYNGGFSEGQIGNQEFNITYGDGEFLLGSMGYEDISLAGLTVRRQEVALVSSGFWQGDSETSGLMGFAYPSLTAATQETYYGETQATYRPFFFNAIEQGLVPPIFSLALGRSRESGSPAGQLALGGIANVQTTSDFVSTPVRTIQLTPDNPLAATNFSYYTIIPDAFILNGQPYPSSATQQQATYPDYASYAQAFSPFNLFPRQDSTSSSSMPLIIDSGTTLVYLPTDLVSAIMQSFSPPSTYISSANLWQNDCEATPPSFAVRISGRDFFFAGEDLLLPRNGGFDSSTGGCVCGIQDAGGGMNILGDGFLRNVLVVFDVGVGVIRLATR